MKKSLIIIAVLLCLTRVFAQEVISYNGSGNYILIEKTDLRRYDNGKYTGLVSREISSYIVPVSTEGGYLYEGSFFVWQDTVRNSMSVDIGINEAIPAVFKISDEGVLTMIEDHGYPSFRSFPSYTNKSIKIGDVWQAKAERAVDPINKGIVTKMPIYVEYKYTGDTNYNGEACYMISAQWATRYGMGGGVYHIDWGGDSDLEKATGSHKATIVVSKATGNALVIRDTVDETFFYTDGNQIQFKGQIAQFTHYPPAVDRSKLIPALKRIASISEEDEKAILEHKVTADEEQGGVSVGLNGGEDKIATGNFETVGSLSSDQNKKEFVTVDTTPAGIRLTIPNLQFKPDSAELLGGENERLDKIAQVLKEVPDCKLLIEGHTAAVGKESGELQLSKERAMAIANALIKRGVSAERLIVKGRGGTKPIADNSTNEGKAKNRRVEITILE